MCQCDGGWSPVNWVTSARYLGIYVESSFTFKCSFVANKAKFYKAFNSIFGTRRPASADRTARRQFQATGQPVSRTQASDGMTSRLPSYEAKYVQRRCFQCRSVPLLSDIKGTELPRANVLIPLEIDYATTLPLTIFYIVKLCSRLFVFYCRNCPKRRHM